MRDPSLGDSDVSPRSLVSPLLSGRSLEPDHRPGLRHMLGEHRAVVATVVVICIIVIAALVGKVLAERAADRDTGASVEEISTILDGATPREFLAFNAGVKRPGSRAERIRHHDGFVNVKAIAESSTIRFQPTGWWSGFTERCIVAVVTDDDVTVTVPKVACVRVGRGEP